MGLRAKLAELLFGVGLYHVLLSRSPSRFGLVSWPYPFVLYKQRGCHNIGGAEKDRF
jgi:hypothetical protein